MLLPVAIAHAATTVLFAGDPGEALRAAAAAGGSWDLRPITPEELVPAPIVAGAAPVACEAPRTNSEVRADVQRAESRVAYQQWMEAGIALRAAAAMLPCLSEPAEASLAGRLWFLFGVAEHGSGHDDYARNDFARALDFEPGMAWDTHFAPDVRAPFDAALADVAGRKRVPVVAGDATLWIDGRPAKADVAAGPHLVQVLQPALATFSVDVADAVTVVTAPAVAAALGKLDAPASRALVDHALAGRGDTLVVADGAVWKPGPWKRLPVPAPRATWLKPALLGAGTTALVVGGAGALVGEAYLLGSVDPAAGETNDGYHERIGSRDDATGWTRAAAVTAGAGAAMVVAGLLQPGPIHLWVGPGIGVAGAW